MIHHHHSLPALVLAGALFASASALAQSPVPPSGPPIRRPVPREQPAKPATPPPPATPLPVSQPSAPPNDIIEQVLVKVNGDILTKSDLEDRQVQVLRARNIKPSNDQDLKKALADITPQLLVDAVDEFLLVQRGRDLGYTLSDTQFNEILANIKKENKIETEEQFENALKQEGLTLAALRKSIERSMIINRVQQVEVFGRIQVSEEEAKKYYETHSKEFTTAPTLMIREILVGVKTDGNVLNVGADEDAKAKAEAIRQRIVNGESFDTLAAELSDSSSKANSGLVGPLQPSELDPALRAVFEGMQPGDISPVTRTSGGYQIFKLESRAETKVLPYEEAREQIANRVATDKRRAEFVKYMHKLRAEAIIDWKNQDLQRLYDAQVKRNG